MVDNNAKRIESIVKARDDNTKEYDNYPQSYLYSIQLSHIEHIQANLYNFKFIVRTINPMANREIYFNLQILIKDSSLVENSKYFIKNDTRLKLVNSYNFDKKETTENSYRVDFSINTPKDESDQYLRLEIVNNASNTSSIIGITKELFFKISIFLYQLLNYNIIDGDIFIKKFNGFRLLVGKKSLLENLTADTKTFTLYWNSRYIICFIDDENRITYACFTVEEFEELLK